uniref:Uncharacterized protein n=1 Tax=Aegilops tauschii subsp. strangulata TaxID=200361 RepID=A0A452XZR8_AEGTS
QDQDHARDTQGLCPPPRTHQHGIDRSFCSCSHALNWILDDVVRMSSDSYETRTFRVRLYPLM